MAVGEQRPAGAREPGPDWAEELPPPGAWMRGGEALKRLLIGRPRPTHELEETLLSKFLALPIFSSDPISSVAYATEAALVVLIGTTLSSGHLVFPLSIGISALLAIVAISYTQVVRAYSSAGGAYVVARDNFGPVSSLVAGAALLVDYVLTVSVSVAGGVLAISSAVPSIAGWNVRLSVISVVVITLVNLRGVRESGLTFALPTYAFLAAMFALVGVGIEKCAVGSCPQANVPHPLLAGTGAIGVFVLLKAFASGSAALTGTESIANGVTAFKRPQSSNAAKTLLMVAAMGIALFLGVSWLAVKMHARPSSSVSVVSELADGVFPHGAAHFMFWVVQVTTFAILILAANTSFQGFPRLAALMARDGYFPRQFSNLGDRLVYSNGIVVLSAIAIALIVVFSANVNSLLHLYVLGVFTAFTLSQFGMVKHWLRTRDSGWQVSAVVNGVGGVATGIVGVIVIATKFTEGAWAVVVAIPLLVITFLGIKRHYRVVARRLRAGAKAVAAQPVRSSRTVLYAERLDQATSTGLWYAQTIAADELHAVHVPFEGADPAIRPRFFRWAAGRPHLEILPATGEPLEAVIDYVWALPHGESDFVTVVVPELFRRPSLAAAVFRPTFALKRRLLSEPGVAIANVPHVLEREGGAAAEPRRAVCIVPISGLHAASLRALRYAETLGLPETRALYLAYDADDAARIRDDWSRFDLDVDLEVVESPYRDLAGPLLARLREITEDPEAVAVVVMPELIVRGVARLLHNQRALYLKRLLLFEPRVILSSVPYQLIS